MTTRRRCAPAALGACVLIGLVGCASEDTPVTAGDYVTALEAVCAVAAGELDALPEPPEQIAVGDFATSAANILTSEAEEARRLDPPSELAADHRAFVRNTDEQAATWRAIATDASAGSGELVALTTQVGQLVLGRNDLVTEMGAAGCRRGEG